jgi:SAM-dependent methyltransferase
MWQFSLLKIALRPHSSDRDSWERAVLEATVEGLKERAQPEPRICNACGHRGLFYPFGWPIRPEVFCPRCYSLERHRLFKLWVDENKQAITNKTIVHFAPDSTRDILLPLAGSYVTADIVAGRGDRILDIENIDMPDASCDVFVCSHVLEHVDDIKALREIHRILTPGGIGLFMVPIIEGWSTTFEDRSITSPSDRAMLFLQSDHVRLYGRDFRRRVTDVGFDLDEFTAVEPYVSRHALGRGGKLFIAKRN